MQNTTMEETQMSSKTGGVLNPIYLMSLGPFVFRSLTNETSFDPNANIIYANQDFITPNNITYRISNVGDYVNPVSPFMVAAPEQHFLSAEGNITLNDKLKVMAREVNNGTTKSLEYLGEDNLYHPLKTAPIQDDSNINFLDYIYIQNVYESFDDTKLLTKQNITENLQNTYLYQQSKIPFKDIVENINMDTTQESFRAKINDIKEEHRFLVENSMTNRIETSAQFLLFLSLVSLLIYKRTPLYSELLNEDEIIQAISNNSADEEELKKKLQEQMEKYQEEKKKATTKRPLATRIVRIYCDRTTTPLETFFKSKQKSITLENLTLQLTKNLEDSVRNTSYTKLWNTSSSFHISNNQSSKYAVVGGNKFADADPLSLIVRVQQVFHVASNTSMSLRPKANPYGKLFVVNIGTINPDPSKGIRLFNSSMQHKQPLEAFKVYLDSLKSPQSTTADLTSLFLYFSHLFTYSENKTIPFSLPDLTEEALQEIRKNPSSIYEFEDLIHESFKELFLRLNDLQDIYIRLVITFSPIRIENGDPDYSLLEDVNSYLETPANMSVLSKLPLDVPITEDEENSIVSIMVPQMNVRLCLEERLPFGKKIRNVSLQSQLTRDTTTTGIKEDILLYRLKIQCALVLHGIVSRNIVPSTKTPAVERIRFLGPCILFQEVLHRVFDIQVTFNTAGNNTLYFILTERDIRRIQSYSLSDVEYRAINLFTPPKITVTPSNYLKLQSGFYYKSTKKVQPKTNNEFHSMIETAKSITNANTQQKQVVDLFEKADRKNEQRRRAEEQEPDKSNKRMKLSNSAPTSSRNNVITRKIDVHKTAFRPRG